MYECFREQREVRCPSNRQPASPRCTKRRIRTCCASCAVALIRSLRMTSSPRRAAAAERGGRGWVPAPSEIDDFAAAVQLIDLSAAWRALGPVDQEVLALHVWDDLSAPDAAIVLGVTRARCAMRLTRVKRRRSFIPHRCTAPVPPATRGDRGGSPGARRCDCRSCAHHPLRVAVGNRSAVGSFSGQLGGDPDRHRQDSYGVCRADLVHGLDGSDAKGLSETIGDPATSPKPVGLDEIAVDSAGSLGDGASGLTYVEGPAGADVASVSIADSGKTFVATVEDGTWTAW